MIQKKLKITLWLLTSLTVLATPIATVVSCGSKNHNKNTLKNHNKNMLVINFDELFEKAKRQSTYKNISNKLIKTGILNQSGIFTINPTSKNKFFDSDSVDYVEPLYALIGDALEIFMEELSEKIPEIKPILIKLKKSNNFYKLTKDMLQGILDSKILIHSKIKNRKFSINELLRSGIGTMVTISTGMKQTPQDIILEIIDSVWKLTKDDLIKTGITVGEIGSLIKHINGYKFGMEIIINKEKITLSEEREIKIPFAEIIFSLFPQDSDKLLSDMIQSNLNIIKNMLPFFTKLPNEPIENIIAKAAKKITSSIKPKNLNNSSVDSPDLVIVMSKFEKLIQRIINKEVTHLEDKQKINSNELSSLLNSLPISKNIKKKLKPFLAIFTKVLDLYQI